MTDVRVYLTLTLPRKTAAAKGLLTPNGAHNSTALPSLLNGVAGVAIDSGFTSAAWSLEAPASEQVFPGRQTIQIAHSSAEESLALTTLQRSGNAIEKRELIRALTREGCGKHRARNAISGLIKSGHLSELLQHRPGRRAAVYVAANSMWCSHSHSKTLP